MANRKDLRFRVSSRNAGALRARYGSGGLRGDYAKGDPLPGGLGNAGLFASFPVGFSLLKLPLNHERATPAGRARLVFLLEPKIAGVHGYVRARHGRHARRARHGRRGPVPRHRLLQACRAPLALTQGSECAAEIVLADTQRAIPKVKDWVSSAPAQQLALLADAFVLREINAVTRDITPTWISQFDSDKGRMAMSLILLPHSLWAACWQLFGHDTLSSKVARNCPHCTKLFYPKRKEQIYCTSQQQQLFAKRRWATANR
jgi:hypothetical protein